MKTSAAAVLAGLALASSGSARDAEPDRTGSEPGPALAALEAAWSARDAEAYLRLWRFGDDDARGQERAFLAESWSGEEAVLAVEAPLAAAGAPGRATASAQVFTVTEPRGRVVQMIYTLERGPEGWAVVGRQEGATSTAWFTCPSAARGSVPRA